MYYLSDSENQMLEHLKTRHFNINIHTVWLAEDCVTFPLWNLTGQLLGYQRYRPSGDKNVFNNPTLGKYFTRIKDKKVGVWGLESWKASNTLFVTEGVFDATRVTNLGYSAIAIMCNSPSPQLDNWLYTVRQFRPVVAVCDNDKAGLQLAKVGHTFHVVEQGDLGDASNEYVENLVKEFAS